MKTEGPDTMMQSRLPMRVTGTSDFEDYAAAFRLHARTHFMYTTILFGLAGLFLVIYRISVPIGILILAYVGIVRPFMAQSRLRTIWDRTPKPEGREYMFEFDDEGLAFPDEKGTRSSVGWDRFIRYKESARTFLLYRSHDMYLFVPKRLLHEGDEPVLRELLKKRVKRRRKTGRLVLPKG